MHNSLLPFGVPVLPALTVPGACTVPASPFLSQIKAVLILPIGVNGPDDWTSSEDVEGVISNASVSNSVGKWLTGIGEIARPESVTTVLGRVQRIITRRRYSLVLSSLISCDEDYNFLLNVQKNWIGFRFWFYTVGGRLLGGSNGIRPCFVDGAGIYGGQRTSVEQGEFLIEWDADGDPLRSYVPGIFGNETASQDAQFEVNVFYQHFPNQVGVDLIWTENGGNITAPFANNLWVFQNGQKLNGDLGQYSVTPGAGSATISINNLTHFDGSHYQVFAFQNP